MESFGFNEWAITAMLGLIVAIVGFMYRDVRRELHAFALIVNEFQKFVARDTERESNWTDWRMSIEDRFNNHSQRMNQISDFCATSKEKVEQLEKWRDRVRHLDNRRSTDE
jgi:hypothetical protein